MIFSGHPFFIYSDFNTYMYNVIETEKQVDWFWQCRIFLFKPSFHKSLQLYLEIANAQNSFL